MRVILFVSFLLTFSACKNSIKPEELYGEWRYVKVEEPNKRPPFVMPQEDLEAARPSIKFTKENRLIIIWEGKQLSNGKFKMDNRMIRYTENLEGGAVREFPFLIKEISDTLLVFETMREDASRITAVKLKKAKP